jgi:hypothetical protein
MGLRVAQRTHVLAEAHFATIERSPDDAGIGPTNGAGVISNICIALDQQQSA